MLACTPALASNTPKDDGLTWLDKRNVVWDSPSTDSLGSMPLGNGSIGLNVWVESDGDLLFYISHTDAYDSAHVLRKLGRVRVHLDPNPFAAGQQFKQALVLRDGAITIDAGSGKISLRIWVDANNPVIHVSGEAPSPVDAVVSVEPIRQLAPVTDLSDGSLPKQGTAGILLDDKSDRLAWCYRNTSSAWMERLVAQGSGEMAKTVSDPIQNRTSGCLVEGNGLVREKADSLRLKQPRRNLDISIHVLTSQPDKLAGWFSEIADQAARVDKIGAANAFAAHKAWWRAFWNRSRIVIGNCGDSPVRLQGCLYTVHKDPADDYWKNLTVGSRENAFQITQRYTLERFCEAAAGRGQVPQPYNGSIFTMDMPVGSATFFAGAGGRSNPESADDRDWGTLPIMWQNTRHPYWSMLTRGDYDTMQTLFSLVTDSLPICKDRCRTWYKHDGAFMTEAMLWKGVSVFDSPPQHLVYHYLGSLEVTAIMFDYYERTQDREFVKDTLLPCADEFIKYYELHYPRRDERGKMIIEPAGVVETYQPVTNPITEISALRYLLTKLISLDASLIGRDRKAHWTELLRAIPDVPRRTILGIDLLAPGDKYAGREIIETPEFYAVYPFRQTCLWNDDFLANARQSFHIRQLSLDGTPDGQNVETGGWQLAPTWAAYLGLPREAARLTSINFDDRFPAFGNPAPPAPGHPRARFPAFWETKFDYTPDNDHGAVSANAVQSMLLQCDGRRIYLLPAWPEDWDVSFKLCANYNTTVECVYRDGKVQSLNVTRESRRSDVIDMSSQANRVRTLVSVACADRSYLFDLPSMLDGRATAEDAGRLKTTGPWLAKYGESLYGAKSGPFEPGAWGGSVFKGSVAYLHILKWPAGKLTLPAIERKITASRCLTGGSVSVTQNDGGITVSAPAGKRDKVDTIVRLEFDGLLEPIAMSAPYRGSLTTGCKATSESAKPGCGPENAVDADAATLWRAADDSETWLEVDLGEPKSFNRVAIHIDNPGHTRAQANGFSVQFKHADGSWATCCEGAVFGDIYEKRIGQVTARFVRLNITAPGVKQFDLFPPIEPKGDRK